MSAGLLLDVNALIALGWASHEAHETVVARLDRRRQAWATCAITQLGFVRVSSTSGVFHRTPTPDQARQSLALLCADKQHRFLTEMPSVLDVDLAALQGPRQTTDAYLVALARHHGLSLLTLDRRLANAFGVSEVELLEVAGAAP